MDVITSLIGFWRGHKGRRDAMRILRPFVDRSLSGGGPDHWNEPTRIGFLSSLITLVAQRETGRIGSDALGVLQAEVWAELTGMSPDLIGERIVSLSLDEDLRFAEGCRNAFIFEAALQQRWHDGPDLLGPRGPRDDTLPLVSDSRDALSSLWERLVNGSPDEA